MDTISSWDMDLYLLAGLYPGRRCLLFWAHYSRTL